MKRKCLAVGIILLFIGTCIIPAIAKNTVKPLPTVNGTNPIITYPALISINIDPDDLELLNHPLMPGDTIHIHLIVGYAAGIPDWLLHPPFQIIKNLFLFGRLVNFPQKITLSVENVPSWADIYFVTPDIYIDISNTLHFTTADLIISLHDNAPSAPRSFSVTATAPQRHRVEERSFTTFLVFSVQWIPNIIISTNQTTIITPPNTMTNVSINVTNEGNRDALINTTTPDIEGWTIEGDPQWLVLPVGTTKQVIIHIIPPEEFQGTQQIELLFTPYTTSGTPASPIPFLLTAQYP